VPSTLAPGETIERAIARACELVEMPAGAPVVLTSGTALDTPGGTSVIALRHLPASGESARPRPAVLRASASEGARCHCPVPGTGVFGLVMRRDVTVMPRGSGRRASGTTTLRA
jgi:hypothetical protein